MASLRFSKLIVFEIAPRGRETSVFWGFPNLKNIDMEEV